MTVHVGGPVRVGVARDAGPGGGPSAGSALERAVWRALDTVLDPEIDEPVTQLGFVASCTVSEDAGDGAGASVAIRLRLPTFFCAPNFSFLMVADAYDAVSAVPGVGRVEVALQDHHASAEINGGVAAQAGFIATFAGEAVEELDELRRQFLTKAAMAGQDRIAQPLVDGGATPEELARTTLLEVPDSMDLRRLRDRRAALGLPHDDDAPLLLHPDGSPVTAAQVPLHLRRARLQRIGIEANGEVCRGLLAKRYPTAQAQ